MNGKEPDLDSTYIGEIITVAFDKAAFLTKKPGCPDKFTWQGNTFVIIETLSAWQDLERRGKFGRNMQDAHARRARVKGSLGVGRFYFRVKTSDSRVFELYYDRLIKSVSESGGYWVLLQELFSSK